MTPHGSPARSPPAVPRRRRAPAGRMARLAGPDRLRRRARRHGGAGRSDRRGARAASGSGSSSIPRSTPQGRAPGTRDLLDPRFPVFRAGRGGQFTYHGPGQRVAYVMLDLRRRRPDVRAYVAALEGWLIGALAAFGVAGETREDRVGVWVAPARQAALRRRRARRGQDRRDRRAGAALGDVPRRRAQRRARPLAFLRHRAVRDRASPTTASRASPISAARATMADVDAALRASFERDFRTDGRRRSGARVSRRRPETAAPWPSSLRRSLAGRSGPAPMPAADSGPSAPPRSRRSTTPLSASGGAIVRTVFSIRASIASARA